LQTEFFIKGKIEFLECEKESWGDFKRILLFIIRSIFHQKKEERKKKTELINLRAFNIYFYSKNIIHFEYKTKEKRICPDIVK
jgi:hypothetical protein